MVLAYVILGLLAVSWFLVLVFGFRDHFGWKDLEAVSEKEGPENAAERELESWERIWINDTTTNIFRVGRLPGHLSLRAIFPFSLLFGPVRIPWERLENAGTRKYWLGATSDIFVLRGEGRLVRIELMQQPTCPERGKVFRILFDTAWGAPALFGFVLVLGDLRSIFAAPLSHCGTVLFLLDVALDVLTVLAGCILLVAFVLSLVRRNWQGLKMLGLVLAVLIGLGALRVPVMLAHERVSQHFSGNTQYSPRR